MLGLNQIGVSAEPARWWDNKQIGDIIHHIGRPSIQNVRLAHEKGFKVVMTDLLDQTASRSSGRLFLQRNFRRVFASLVPRFTSRLDWEVFHEIDAMVYSVGHEWEVAKYVFGADRKKGYVVPHGLEKDVLEQLGRPQQEEDYLISVATIHPRKNSVLLAEAARVAQMPVVFLGKPYSEDDAYFQTFRRLIDNKFVRYPGFVSTAEKFQYLRGSRGFVLLSQFESGCIAVFEAAGAGLPLLLSDLPWARKSYPAAREIAFTDLSSPERVAAELKHFYNSAHRKSISNFPILSWDEVALQYRTIYDDLLSA